MGWVRERPARASMSSIDVPVRRIAKMQAKVPSVITR